MGGGRVAYPTTSQVGYFYLLFIAKHQQQLYVNEQKIKVPTQIT